MKSNLVDIHATIVRETEKALLLDTGDRENYWVPKSIVEDNGDGPFTMPRDFAYEKGMI